MSGKPSAGGSAEPPAAEEGYSSDEEADLVCAGYLQDNIVGIQYYTGEVARQEMVQLIREPENPYDSYAIRVDNVRGVKVGHLPRVLVCHLSPLVDSGLLHLEGTVPSGTNNVYKMPVLLFCFCRAEDRARLQERLRRVGRPLIDPSQPASPGGSRGRGGASPSGAVSPPPRLTPQQMESSIDRLFDELLAASGPRPRLDPAPEVLSPLYGHQKEALAWMVQRENGNGLPPFWEPRVAAPGAPLQYASQLTNFIANERPAPLRGGILADDMGLGKTLEVISLIATNRPGAPLPRFFTEADEAAAAAAAAATAAAAGPSGSGGAAAAGEQTAAAAEEAAAEEEEEERPKKRQRKGKEKVGEAAAGGKAAAAAGAKKPSKLEAEAAERAAAAEPAAAPPAAGELHGTLIVCPLSVLSNWTTQLEEHTAGSLKVCVYHGPDRDRSVKALESFDVVITTYQTLAAEANARSGLCRARWLRVVLDEAHTVKNPNTAMAKAARSLNAARRWAVTGTPLQNSLRDLHGICAFLRLDTLEDRALFTRCMERPIKAREPGGLKRLQVLMGAIAMRRMKDMQVNGRPIVSLPPKTVHHVRVQLDEATRAKYERWQSAGRAVVERHLADGTLLQNYTAVLEILLRLRQICCAASLAPGEDPSFLSAPHAAAAASAQALDPAALAALVALLRAGLDDECPVCLGETEEPVITLCRHIFCRRCIEMVVRRDKPACPLCRAAVTERDLVALPPEEPAADGANQASTQASPGASGSGAGGGAGAAGPASAKIAALLERLRQDAAASAAASAAGGSGGVRPVKSVVFSQFTSFLDLVQPALAAEGFATARIDGKVTAKRRAEVLRAFASGAPGAPTVLLCSLKAGGVGLNLVAASHVHLLDPWWNPSVEEQAADRVHRLGQTRDVHIFRYTALDSIEERMLELQERKRDLMKAREGRAGWVRVRVAFDRRRPEEVRQMRLDDIRSLMEL